MKRILLALTASAFALSFAGCAANSPEKDIADKTYVYEKGGFAGIGEFGIKLNRDGTFSYYEGYASSYVGYGNWGVENGELILSDDEEMGCLPFVNRFKIDGGDLVFQAEGSTNFMYVKVSDGERFSSSNN